MLGDVERVGSMIKSLVLAHWHSSKSGFCPPTETGNRGIIFIDDCISRG